MRELPLVLVAGGSIVPAVLARGFPMTVLKSNLRRLRLFGILLMVGLSCFLLTRWFEHSSSDVLALTDESPTLEPASLISSSSSFNAKLIIQWTTVFGNRMAEANMDGCSLPPENSCHISSDRSRINEAAAVVFHISDGDLKINDLPTLKDRRPDQLYLFMTMETPPNHNRTLIASLPAHFFNLTMTYRRDSDIPFVYGGYWVEPSIAKRLGFAPENLPYDEKAILSGKRKPVFWLVSNCFTKSRREVAIEKLRQYIPIDIFGKCATNKTDRDKCKHNQICERQLATEYYFFIAAENSICKDYITEKYWSRYTWPTVPIVMRRYIYDRLLPPKSFIAMDDFANAKQMAAYLQELISNKTAFMEYFAWRSLGWARPWQKPPYSFAYCKLCERLHGDMSPSSIQSVEDWFYGTSQCEGHEFVDSWLDDH